MTLFLNLSCTTIKYSDSSSGKVNISSPRVSNKLPIEFVVHKKFILWGSYPEEGHHLDLSDEVFKNSAYLVGNVTLVHSQSSLDKWITFLSLGLVIPYTITVKAWGEVVDANK